MLTGLPIFTNERVLLGAAAGDDAGVFRLDDATDAVLTVDVFAPSVDDAYTFGQVAAANSVSDVYAMGATPQAALSIVGFPIHALPPDQMRAILAGGIDKLAEAGVPVVGGHSINDEELKCGFAVLGTTPAGRYLTHEGARPGDALVLTKPIGGGVVLFGAQVGRASAASVARVTEAMTMLNRAAGEALFAFDARAATDVTGFSLLGHLAEIVRKNGVEATLDFEAIPLFPDAEALARQDVLPGAVERNREATAPELLDLSALTEAQAALLFSPETSGGLLASLPAERAEAFVAHLRERGVADAAVIGSISGPADGGRIRVTTRTAEAWSRQALAPLPATGEAPPAEPAPADGAAACCCSGGAGDAVETETPSCCGAPPSGGGAAANGAPVAPAETAPAGSNDGGFLVPLPAGEAEAFGAYMQAINAPGALGSREKKLLALALSVLTKCEPCVKIQTRAARDAGASDAEIAEAAAMAVGFGGAPVRMFYETLCKRGR